MNGNLISDTNIIKEAARDADLQREEVCPGEPVSFGRRLRRLFWHIFARQFMLLCVITSTIAGWVGRKKRPLGDEGCEIMLTGRFDSKNWILAHLVPLAESKQCSHLWMVSTNPVPAIPKVEAIYPPKWLVKSMGETPSRLLIFLWAAMRKRPHLVGGFHIMPNGIAAVIAGRLAGARSIYFSVGGPLEVYDGGVYSETSYFRKMETPDPLVEKRLLQVIFKFEMIITMGTRAVQYFHNKGIKANFHVLSGGINTTRFRPVETIPFYDLVLTGRLVELKRIDVFLQAVKLVADKIPEVKVLIAGDGKLLAELKQMARDLDITRNVYFAGYQNNLENWLQKSKIFVLTSDSEGLSLSMMEAMMCGLPAIVSNVGDLGDLVEDAVNGFLVPRRCPEQFAARIIELLTDENKLRTFSQAARNAALQYSTQTATQKWDNIIENCRSC